MKSLKVLFVSIFIAVVSVFLVSCGDGRHEHELIVHEKVEATCTTNGTIAYYECSVCSRMYADEACTERITKNDLGIPATGHSTVEHAAVGATCTDNGSVRYYECTDCGVKFADAAGTTPIENIVDPAKGHSMTHHAAVPADCVNAGSIAYYECTVCDKLYADEAGATEITLADTVDPAKGHSMTHHAAVPADCVNPGTIAYYECTVCHKNYADEAGNTPVENIVDPAKGHSMTHHEAVASDCVTHGSIAYYECTVCHKLYADQAGATEITLADTVAPLGSHAMTFHAAVAPSCGVDGTIAYYECTVCHKLYTDEAGQNEVQRADLVDPAVDHTLVNVPANMPANGGAGNIAYYECTTCHKYYRDEAGTDEIVDKNVTVYGYLVTKQDAKTPGYYVDYRDSKTFVDNANEGVFVSNNKGQNSSSAFIDIKFTAAGVVSFNYSVSSESGWDKLFIFGNINGAGNGQIGAAHSGNESGTLTFNVIPGDYLTFQYQKDSSGDGGSDTATISNILFVTTELFEKYTLTFDTNGGNAIDAISAFGGVALELPEATKDGHFFDGWYADSQLTVPFNAEAGISANVTAYAKYTKGLVVSYANTGDATVDSVLVRPNAEIIVPDVTPTTDGKYFDGWYSDQACTVPFDFASGVTVDTVVYAGWRNPVIVTFDAHNGAAVETVSTDINVAVTLPANPVLDGYRFDGWYTDEDCTVAFDAEAGVAGTMTVHAKWVEQVTVTYMYNGQVVGTEVVDINSAYTATTPETFGETVTGWYTDDALANEFVNGTALATSINLYAKVHSIAPDGVLTSFVNGGGSNYEWIYDGAANTFTSSNSGANSSASVLTLTFAKESFVSFSYLVNSESNYDFLVVTVNGTQDLSTKISGYNGKDVTGSYSNTFAAGDVVEIRYKKDSSGNQGNDWCIITDLIINDGIPSISVTLDYIDEGVEDVVIPVGINSLISDIENLDSYAPADTDARHFGGWYYDAACTNAVNASDSILKDTTLYAKYIYPATITFDTDGAGEIAPISVWTGIDVTDVMPANPAKAGYIFRYWMNENAEEFDPVTGVAGDMLLTAYFEELPVGATKEEALVAELVDGSFVAANLETNEEFQVFYVKFVAPKTDYYYFDFATYNRVGGTARYDSYRRYAIVDADGNSVLSATSSEARVELTEGVTYYITYNLGSGTNTGWGTFTANILQLAQDHASEAVDYTFGEVITTGSTTFRHGDHEVVYKYVAEATGTYALHLSSNAWGGIRVYDDASLSTTILNKSSYAKNTVFDLSVVEGETYYLVLNQNWSNSVLATNTITFKLVEYPQGYTANNPFAYTLGDILDMSFGEGANVYYSVEVTENGTYRLDILTLADTNSKTIEIYEASDLTKVVATLAGAAAAHTYIEDLAEGTYIIKGRNTSTSYNTAFTASFVKVEEGHYWSTAADLTLASSNTLNALPNGYYYQFTTGSEELWHFFNVSNGSVAVYNTDRTLVGSNGLHLPANTDYILVVTADSQTVTVDHSTLVEYADGKSPAGAFVYDDTTKVLDTSTAASYSVYYKLTVAESGTYRICTYNTADIDTKGYLYSNSEFSSQIKYNDDGGADMVTAGHIGYKYDFYFEIELEAGVTYYLKVTYSVYARNQGASLTCNVTKVA